MLVAMARKLAVTLWHYVEAGLLPEDVLADPEESAMTPA
jgi:hypothetical protein